MNDAEWAKVGQNLKLLEKVKRTRLEHILALQEFSIDLGKILERHFHTDYFLDRLSRRYYDEDGYTRYIDYRDDPHWFMNPLVTINDRLLIDVRVSQEFEIENLYFENVPLSDYLTDKFREYGSWIIFK